MLIMTEFSDHKKKRYRLWCVVWKNEIIAICQMDFLIYLALRTLLFNN